MSCLFCKIVLGEIPARVIYEDADIMAFLDIVPQAPTHILLIPKKHIATINDIAPQDEDLLRKLIIKAREIARLQQLEQSGYRLVFNVNADGGQTVYHIHLHLLGGRQMTWPPG